MNTDTVAQIDYQQAAVTALLALVRDTPGTGTTEFKLQSSFQALTISIHNDPAGFEWWREALGLAPDTVQLTDFGGFTTLDLPGQVGSLRVDLVAFLPALDTPAVTTVSETAASGTGS